MLTLIAILLLLAIFGCAIAVLDHWVWADRSVEWRFAEGYPEHLPALAADLVRAKVDIILAENPQAIWFSILGDTAAHFKCRPCLMHRQTCDEKMDIDATALSQGLASERISTPPACDRR